MRGYGERESEGKSGRALQRERGRDREIERETVRGWV